MAACSSLLGIDSYKKLQDTGTIKALKLQEHLVTQCTTLQKSPQILIDNKYIHQKPTGQMYFATQITNRPRSTIIIYCQFECWIFVAHSAVNKCYVPN